MAGPRAGRRTRRSRRPLVDRLHPAVIQRISARYSRFLPSSAWLKPSGARSRTVHENADRVVQLVGGDEVDPSVTVQVGRPDPGRPAPRAARPGVADPPDASEPSVALSRAVEIPWLVGIT